MLILRALAILVAITAASASASANGVKQITYSAHFNVPGGPSGGTELEDLFLSLLDSTPAGETVHMSVYSWSSARSHIRDALVAAAGRGVKLNIIKEDDLFADTLRGVSEKFTICFGSCMGSIGGINHNKIFLFSHVDAGAHGAAGDHVVVQSSANWTDGQLGMFNNSLVIKNDGYLYRAYFDYWNALFQSAYGDRLNYNTTATGWSPSLKAYFFPRSDQVTMVEVLNRIDCSGGGEIRVLQLRFPDTLPAFGNKLIELKNAGCTITYIMHNDEAMADATLKANMQAAGIVLRKVLVHSKEILVNAKIDGSGSSVKMVFTGSLNVDQCYWFCDEAAVELKNDAIYDAYKSNFDAALAVSVAVP